MALIKPESVGPGLTAYITVRLEKHLESHKLSPLDNLLRVLVADMAHCSRFIMDTLLRHVSVQDCKTGFVLGRVKFITAVPLRHAPQGGQPHQKRGRMTLLHCNIFKSVMISEIAMLLIACDACW